MHALRESNTYVHERAIHTYALAYEYKSSTNSRQTSFLAHRNRQTFTYQGWPNLSKSARSKVISEIKQNSIKIFNFIERRKCEVFNLHEYCDLLLSKGHLDKKIMLSNVANRHYFADLTGLDTLHRMSNAANRPFDNNRSRNSKRPIKIPLSLYVEIE